MVERRIVGYRQHPAFKTLTQEIFECGHVRSAPTAEIEFAQGQKRRCIKCNKGMPSDLRAQELPSVNVPDVETPLLQRLCNSLAFHLAETESVRRQLEGDMPELDAAIIDAHKALSRSGFKVNRFKVSKS